MISTEQQYNNICSSKSNRDKSSDERSPSNINYNRYSNSILISLLSFTITEDTIDNNHNLDNNVAASNMPTVKATTKSTTGSNKIGPSTMTMSNTTPSIFGTTALDTKFYRYMDRIKKNDPSVTKIQLSLKRESTATASTSANTTATTAADTPKPISYAAIVKASSNSSVASESSKTSKAKATTTTGATTTATTTTKPAKVIVKGDLLAKEVAKAVKHNSVVTDIYCRNLQITATGCIDIAHNILLRHDNPTTIAVLDLSYNNKIGDKGIHTLAEGLQFNTSITKLYLDDCAIGPDGIAILFHSIIHRKVPLQELGLRENNLGTNDGLKVLLNILKSKQQDDTTPSHTLQKLYLSSNNIDNDGIQCFCESLVDYDQSPLLISNLYLDSNIGISDASVYAISGILQNLNSIDLSNNTGITDTGVQVLLDQLKLNFYNNIDKHGADDGHEQQVQSPHHQFHHLRQRVTELRLIGTSVSEALQSEIDAFYATHNPTNDDDNLTTAGVSTSGFLSLATAPNVNNSVVSTSSYVVPNEIITVERNHGHQHEQKEDPPSSDVITSTDLLQKLAFESAPPFTAAPSPSKSIISTASSYRSVQPHTKNKVATTAGAIVATTAKQQRRLNVRNTVGQNVSSPPRISTSASHGTPSSNRKQAPVVKNTNKTLSRSNHTTSTLGDPIAHDDDDDDDDDEEDGDEYNVSPTYTMTSYFSEVTAQTAPPLLGTAPTLGRLPNENRDPPPSAASLLKQNGGTTATTTTTNKTPVVRNLDGKRQANPGLVVVNEEKIVTAIDAVVSSIETLSNNQKEATETMTNQTGASLQSIQEQVARALDERFSTSDEKILLDSKEQTEAVLQEVNSIVDNANSVIKNSMFDTTSSAVETIKTSNNEQTETLKKHIESTSATSEDKIVSTITESVSKSIGTVLSENRGDAETVLQKLQSVVGDAETRIASNILEQMTPVVVDKIVSDNKERSETLRQHVESVVQTANSKLTETVGEQISVHFDKVVNTIKDNIPKGDPTPVIVQPPVTDSTAEIAEKVTTLFDSLRTDSKDQTEKVLKQIDSVLSLSANNIISTIKDIDTTSTEAREKLSSDNQMQKNSILTQVDASVDRAKDNIVSMISTNLEKIISTQKAESQSIVHQIGSVVQSNEQTIVANVVEKMASSIQTAGLDAKENSAIIGKELQSVIETSKQEIITTVSQKLDALNQKSSQDKDDTASLFAQKILQEIGSTEGKLNSAINNLGLKTLEKIQVSNQHSTSAVVEEVLSVVESSQSKILSHVETVISTLDVASSENKEQAESVIKKLESVIGSAKDTITATFENKLVSSTEAIRQEYKEQAGSVVKQVEEVIGFTENKIASSIGKISSSIDEFRSRQNDGQFESITKHLETAVESVESNITGSVDKIASTLGQVATQQKEQTESATKHLEEVLGATESNITTSVRQLSSSVEKFITSNKDQTGAIVQQLQSDLNRSQNEITRMMKQHAEELKNLMELTSKSINDSTKVFQEQQVLSRRLEEQVKHLQESQNLSKSELQNYEIQVWKEKVATTEQVANEAKNRSQAYERQLELSKNEYNALEKKYNELQDDLRGKLAAAQQRIQDTTTNSATLTSQLQESRTEYADLDAKNAHLKSLWEQAKADCATLESQLQSSRRDYTSIEQRNNELSILLNRTQNEITELKATLDTVENEVPTQTQGNQDLQTLTDRVSSLESELDLRHNEYKILEQRNSDAQHLLQEAKSYTLSLEFQLESSKNECEELLKQRSDLRDLLKEAEDNVLSLESNLETSRYEYSVLNEQHEDMMQQVQKEVLEMHANLEECQELIANSFIKNDFQRQKVILQNRISEENINLHQNAYDGMASSDDEGSMMVEFVSREDDSALLLNELRSVNARSQQLIGVLKVIKDDNDDHYDIEAPVELSDEEMQNKGPQENAEDSSGSVDVEYMKNILLSLFNARTATEKKALIPVVASVLSLNEEELKIVSAAFEEKKSSYLGLF